MSSTKVTATNMKVINASAFVITLLLSISTSYSQVVMIDTGDANNDELGWDVAFSGDAKIMAVGTPRADPNGVNSAGHVRLYSKDGLDWKMFQQINGTLPNNYFGYSIDLSHDGSMLAVGTLASAGYGDVYMYELSNSSFLYTFLAATGDIDAYEVSVSGDGSTVGVTTFYAVRIFVRIGDIFEERGYKSGYGYFDEIALNYNGTIAAIGDSAWSNSRGRVSVFQLKDGNSYRSMEWLQMGSDITGDVNGDEFGRYGCVSITYNGLTVAVGAEGYDSDGLYSRGLVRVYNYVITEETWEKNLDLVGDRDGDRFSKTSLSSDGKYLAVGAYRGNYVKIFEKIGNNYEVIGGETSLEGGYFGSSVALSADGRALATGAYSFQSARGRVYLLGGNDVTTTEITSLPSTSPSLVPHAAPLPISVPSSPSGNGNGDPHFTTFSGISFDYHGECDLVMFSNPSFASGSGLSVHIRTTRMDGRLLSYSYISGAAVSIGHHILEVQQDGTLFLNGKRYDASHVGGPNANNVSLPTKFATYPFTKNMIGKKKKITQYVLNLTDTKPQSMDPDHLGKMIQPMAITIHINPKTHMLFVKIDGYFRESIGLLGDPLAGDRLLGRDGVTDISHNWEEYGEEWQVRDTEPKLFQEHRAPQYPDSCIYYVSDSDRLKKTHNLRRRLMSNGGGDSVIITKKAANEACADFVGINKNNCVHDVMVMRDLEVAEDPSYIG